MIISQPLPPPLSSSVSRSFFRLSHSAREVKCHSVSLLSRLPINPHSESRATVVRETERFWLLGTWSCAHNSHFVAWKQHTRAGISTHIATESAFAQSTSSRSVRGNFVLIMITYCHRFAYTGERNHASGFEGSVIYLQGNRMLMKC